MQNSVPAASVASRTVERTLDRRRATYAGEVGRLVEAALRLIREHADLEPRVSEIVAVAGLSNQAFYRHFRSKHELLMAVLDEGVCVLRGYLEHRMQRVDKPTEKIREWLTGMLEQALDSEAAAATRPFALSRGRLAERFAAEVADSERQLTAMLRDAIEAAVAAGELTDADPDRDAETLYDMAMGWLQRRVVEERVAGRDEAEHLIDFAMYGLLRRSRGGSDNEGVEAAGEASDGA